MFIVETWLGERATVPIGPVVADVREVRDNELGRRAVGGILVIAHPRLLNDVRVSYIDEKKRFVEVEYGDTTIVCPYFPPSCEATEFYSFCRRINRLSRTRKVIMVGDLNARMREVTGDHVTNTRGRWLRNFLQNSNLQYVQPSEGKWTTYTFNGRGITDVVLSNRNYGEIASVAVKEQEDIGGSDHRPLIIQISNATVGGDRQYTKWNINKLKKVDIGSMYREELEDTFMPIQNTLLDIERKISELEGQVISYEERSTLVEEAWNEITTWIEAALHRSCGKLSCHIRANRDFLTREMKDLLVEMDIARNEAQEAVDAGACRQELRNKWRRYGALKSRWNKRVNRRRTVVFLKTIDLLDDPQEIANFSKVVSGMKKRNNRAVSQLDPRNMEEYRDHFQSTFGEEPQGDINLVDIELLERTNPRAAVKVGKTEETTTINRLDVESILKNMSNGKAAGTDGLPIEVWKFGGAKVVEVVVKLFEFCTTLRITPNKWNEVHTVPIFKNKGEITNIEYYRPISLTCAIRRAFEQVYRKVYQFRIDQKLCSTQGGFRLHRSTYDQIFILHEALLRNAEAIAIFLDIKAAYDSVDRRILWTYLFRLFGFPEDVIIILRSLFDFNISYIVVKGCISRAIANLRGLLQGSAESPNLFNVFIDSLIVRLIMIAIGFFTVQCFINNLFFADDGVILTDNNEDAQEMLTICEEWAGPHGIEFAPAKCAATSNQANLQLQLYGQPIQQVAHYEYLGVHIGAKGIDWELSMKARIEKARNLLFWFKGKGMNSYGWRPSQALRVYKSFIRPIMEYGMGLQILPGKVIKQIQGVQNLALRLISGTHKGTSIAALHIVFGLETMDQRNQILNVRYMHSIVMGDRSITLVGEVVDHILALERRLPASSLIAKFRKQSRWGGEIDRLLPEFPNFEETNNFLVTGLQKLQEKGSISKCLVTVGSLTPTVIIKQAKRLPRELIRSILQWKLGNLGNHKPCKQCGLPITKPHIINCSGAQEVLENIVDDEGYDVDDYMEGIPSFTILDGILNLMELRPNWRVLETIGNMLMDIKINILGYTDNTKEEYSDDEDPMDVWNQRLAAQAAKNRRN